MEARACERVIAVGVACIVCAVVLAGCGGFSCTEEQTKFGCTVCTSKEECTECKEGFEVYDATGQDNAHKSLNHSMFGDQKKTCTFPCTPQQATAQGVVCMDDSHILLCSDDWYPAEHGKCDWYCNDQQISSGCTECDDENTCTQCKSEEYTIVDRDGSKFCADKSCSETQVEGKCLECAEDACTSCASEELGIKDGKCVYKSIAEGRVDTTRESLNDLKPAGGWWLDNTPENENFNDPKIRNRLEWPVMGIDEDVAHLFVVGDWGAPWKGNHWVFGRGKPGCAGPCMNSARDRAFRSGGIDANSQIRVADAMKERQKTSQARYVINVGDSFYWGGLEDTMCGGEPRKTWDLNKPSTAGGGMQWKNVFEEMYSIPHPVDQNLQVPWFSVLGNHDYGGMHGSSGWDHLMWYTYKDEGKGRWRMPGMYWRQTVEYRTFKVDWFMLDGNYVDADAPGKRRGHNICYQMSRECYQPNAGYENVFFESRNKGAHGDGRLTVGRCQRYFMALWEEQMVWLAGVLKSSTAHWTGLVAHYPNNWDEPRVLPLIRDYKVDMVMAGHTHYQTVSQDFGSTANVAKNPNAPHIKGCEFELKCAANQPCAGCPLRFISGGGGGIAAESSPSEFNNAYGFFDVTLTKDEMTTEIIAVGGKPTNLPTSDGTAVTAYKLPRKKKVWEGGAMSAASVETEVTV